MRALLVTAAFGSDAQDPTALEVRRLARALVAAGDRVTVLAVDGPGHRAGARRVTEPGFEVVLLAPGAQPDLVSHEVSALLAEGRPDVAQAFALAPPLVQALVELDAAAVPILHRVGPAGSAFALGWDAVRTRRLCGRFARVLVADAAAAQQAIDAGVDPMKVVQLPSGPSPWGQPPPGFDDELQPLHRAWAEVLEERPRRALPPRRRLVAVVLNDRALPLTLGCLQALARSTRPPDAVVVVDNASLDGSAAFLRAQSPEVQVLEVEAQGNFAAAANAGLTRALALGADRVLFLSGEVEVLEDTVARLESAMDRSPELGVLGPTLREKADPDLVLTDGIAWNPRTGRLKHPAQGAHFKGAAEWELRQVDGLSSQALLLQRRALEQVGLFDGAGVPRFLALDFCLRARALGFGVACVPSASALVSPRPPRRNEGPVRRYFEVRTQLKLAAVHAPGPRVGSFLRGATIVATQAAQVLRSREPRRPRALFELARGVVDAVRAD